MQTISFFRASLCAVLFVVGCSPAEHPTSESIPVSTAVAQPQASKPNLIWILLDACRADRLSCYGNARVTSPNMDRLGARGLVAEQNFAQTNQTFTSVPSYMTGRYFPVDIFFNAPWERIWRTPPENEVLFPSIMKENGYKSLLVSAHGRFSAEGRLWPLFDEAIYHSPNAGSVPEGPGSGPGSQVPMEKLIDSAIAWIENNNDKPFFCYIHALDTHFPHYIDRPPYDQWLDKTHTDVGRLQNESRTSVRWDNRSTKHDPKRHRYSEADQEYLLGLYDGSLLYSDEQIGRLLRRLEALGTLQDTVIVISSDHGDALGENGVHINHHSYVNTDEVHHVPLIIAGPGVPEGLRISTLTENSDIVPTLIDILDLKSNGEFNGLSMLPLFENPDGSLGRDYVFMKPGTYYDEQNGDRLFVLRGTEYKYARSPRTGEEFLWSVPDLLGQREEVSDANPEVLASMRKYLDENIMPLYVENQALPFTSPRLIVTSIHPTLTEFSPSDAVVKKDNDADGKWTFRNAYLASGPHEDAPPVTLHIPLPSWKFRAVMVLAIPDGESKSSLMVKAQEETEFRLFEVESNGKRGVSVDIGTYDLTDGFYITLNDADNAQWAILESFRFYPIGDGETLQANDDDLQMRQEQLRALGYLE